jgi:hypothetical protein
VESGYAHMESDMLWYFCGNEKTANVGNRDMTRLGIERNMALAILRPLNSDKDQISMHCVKRDKRLAIDEKWHESNGRCEEERDDGAPDPLESLECVEEAALTRHPVHDGTHEHVKA